jgi:radical SAM protein with 4Fe4S-binding SPASM domain
MCNIWREGISSGSELSLGQYDAMLSNPFFSNISASVLSGGEAFLRPDFVDLVLLLFRRLTRLRKVTVASNGLATDMTLRKTEEILQGVKQRKGVQFTVQVSYDGVSEIHDRIRAKNAHVKVTKTLQSLMALREQYRCLGLSAVCVIQPLNLHEIEQVQAFLKKNRIQAVFPVVCQDSRFFKNESSEGIRFSDSQVEEVKRLLRRVSREEANPGLRLLYRDFRGILNGRVNSRGCPTMRDTITIEPNGNIVPCINSGENVLGNVLTEDVKEFWFSGRTLGIIEDIQKEKCRTCMLACGAGYLEVLKYILWDEWRNNKP